MISQSTLKVLIQTLILSTFSFSVLIAQSNWDLNVVDHEDITVDPVEDKIIFLNVRSGDLVRLGDLGPRTRIDSGDFLMISRGVLQLKGTSIPLGDPVTHVRVFRSGGGFNDLDIKRKQNIETTEELIPPPIPIKERYISESVLPLHDANKLAETDNKEIIIEILSKYGVTPDALNPLLSPIRDVLDVNLADVQASDVQAIDGNLLSRIGGFDVTQYADGLAKFLVNRAKEELNIAFFDKFKKAIEEDSDLNTLFPSTARSLGLIGDEFHNYSRYITILRESFERDLKLLPDHIPLIIRNHSLFFDSQYPGLDSLLISSIGLVTDLRDQRHPGEALANFETRGIEKIDIDLRGTIETLQLASAMLRDSSDRSGFHYWVKEEQIQKLIRDKKAFRYFLGLMRELSAQRNIRFEDSSLAEFMDEVGNKWDEIDAYYRSYREYFNLMSTEISDLSKLIQTRKEGPKQDLDLIWLLSYFDASVDIIEVSLEIQHLLPQVEFPIQQVERFISLYRDGAEMVVNVNKNRYGAAITNAMGIISQITSAEFGDQVGQNRSADLSKELKSKSEKSYKALTKIYPQLNSSQQRKLYRQASINQPIDVVRLNPHLPGLSRHVDTLQHIYTYEQQKWTLTEGSETMSRLMRYGNFIATVAQAENSDEVAAAIESFALPVGSARIKRTADFNVALNAYLGPVLGYEPDQKVWSTGISAPVGITLSWGNPDASTIQSFSLFATVIDVGAITTYRFEDQDSDVPKIYLREIFSPGIFMSFGFKNVLSFNLGYQSAPLLSRLTSDMSEVSISRKGRLSATLGVDIPLFNFFTKTD